MSGTTDSSAPAIEVRDLRVDYGNFVAVSDISFSVPRGEVLGLVGPNGAGKTSTFRVLATLMEPTYGEVKIGGIDVLEDREKTRQIMGYMPDLAPVPRDLKVWEFLDFHADTHALGSKKARRDRVDECLETVKLTEKRTAWCKALSRGQMQRLVLAKTMLHRPEVLILDEPASGLDPLSRRELRLALQGLAREGATIFVSSHILGELDEMCSTLCIMNQGQLLAAGTADEVRDKMGRGQHSLTATFLNRAGEAAQWLKSHDGVHDVEIEGDRVTCGFTGSEKDQAELLSEIVGTGFPLKSFEEQSSSFEEILIEVAENNRET